MILLPLPLEKLRSIKQWQRGVGISNFSTVVLCLMSLFSFEEIIVVGLVLTFYFFLSLGVLVDNGAANGFATIQKLHWHDQHSLALRSRDQRLESKPTWCTIVENTGYMYDFDEGLASFLAFQLQPTNALEINAGIGIYCEYLVRIGQLSGPVYGVESHDMRGAGVFDRLGCEYPKQIIENVFEKHGSAHLSHVGKFDLVYGITFEVDMSMIALLKPLTSKYLVLSLGPGEAFYFNKHSESLGILESHGFYHLPGLSTILQDNCDDFNEKNKENSLLVFGVSMTLDTNVPSPRLTRSITQNHTEHEMTAERMLPVLKETKKLKQICEAD